LHDLKQNRLGSQGTKPEKERRDEDVLSIASSVPSPANGCQEMFFNLISSNSGLTADAKADSPPRQQ
jgi:hypothetical protein